MLLVIVVWIILQTQWGQNWLAKQVTTRLSRDLQTKISIRHVDFAFFNKMNLEGVLIEDRKHDTLLYAGKLQVRITDWFFFKSQADLKYIGLEDAVVHFNRTDSVWNYQFLKDYFASEPGKEPRKKAGIAFDIKIAELKNVLFKQNDAWSGQDMYLKFDRLYLDANELTLSGKNIDINSLELVKPVFTLFSYPKLNSSTGPLHTTVEIEPQKIDTLLQWNSAGLDLRIGRMTIQDGRFNLEKKSDLAALESFDGKHLDFFNINGSFTVMHWQNDTIKTNINLEARERSGLIVRSVKTDMKLHPQAMEFENLDLHTNNSVIRDYYAMRFDKFSDMSDYIHKVKMEANFVGADIDSDDIGFFAPSVRSWEKRIRVSGRVRGSVDELNADDLVVQAGNNTYMNGDITLSGLPNINQTFIDFRAKEFRTTYNDAARFVPEIRNVKPVNLAALEYVNFQGNFTGFIRDFVTYGTIQTNLGTLSSDLNMKLPEGQSPVYSGSIASSNFRLGEFLRTKDLGYISFDGAVKGRGFSEETVNAEFDGKIKALQYKGYTYQNLEARAKWQKRQFDGYFAINDPNAELELNGLIDFGGELPKFDVIADVKSANLQALNLLKDNLSFNGKFNLNFTGDHIDNFLGNARIYEASLIRDGIPLSFDSLIVSSSYTGGIKTLTANSNEFAAVITGEFDVDGLPDAFKLFLNKYYPSYIEQPRTVLSNQAFTFDITTGNIEQYMPLVAPMLSGFNNSHITGSLNSQQNNLQLVAEVPYFSFRQYTFSDAVIKADGNFDRLSVTGNMGNVSINDSLNLPQTSFSVQSQNDISDVTISTTANQAINQANLAARVNTYTDGVKLTFNPSSFVLNGKTWTIQEGGELEFRRNAVTQGEVVLTESNQLIRIRTVPSGIGDWNDVELALQNLNIGDLSPMFMKKNRLEGLISGNIHVEDPQRKAFASGTIRTQELRLDNDSIGEVEATVTYDYITGELKGFGKNLDPEHQIAFEVDMDFKDSTNLHKDKITVRPTNYSVKLLERFIGTLFSDMQGYVTGLLEIVGEGSERRFIGKGRLRDAGLKVNFTQVFYKIEDTEINLLEDAIDFGTLKLIDTITGNTATVRGSIQHEGFRDMFYDISAVVDDEPVMLLNTNYKDNQAFYGRATGTGSFSLTGPQYNMFMDISARASDRDSSYIILPPARSRESGLATFLVERKYGREMVASDLRGDQTNMTYEINLVSNPLVNMQVILDDLTGDIIEGKGEGNLFISGGTNEPLSIRGRYNLEQGKYDYTFQSLFKKPFELRPGNNYIEWTGDPYTATINLDAVYIAEEVSFSPLAQLPGLSSSIGNYRGDVNVIAKMTGELFHPNFEFRLEFPDNSLNNDPGFAFNIQQIQSNPNEINKQVTYLIVFNSFAPVENTPFTSGVFNEFAYNTISGLFFGEVNKRLNQLLSKILQDNDVTLNFSGSLYNRNLIDQDNSGGFSINQGNFNLTLGKSFFNDRFTISFGSTLDVPLQSTIQQTIQFLPDVTLEWKINQSGTIRASFFYRENLDQLAGAVSTNRTNKRTGGSLSYRKEFNTFKELFGRRRLPKKPPVTTTDSTGTQ